MATSAVARHGNVVVVNQNLSQDSVDVTLSGQSALNPIYQVQTAPPIQEQQETACQHCNGAALPVPVTLASPIGPIYPQLQHDHSRHNDAEPHFQVRYNTKRTKARKVNQFF